MSEPIRSAKELQFADYNPRSISEHDFEALQNSMAKFGDLSCITSNVRTGNLVGGHQRLRALFAKYKDNVVIELREKFTTPDEYGTTATGFISIAGTTLRFAYREVDWPLSQAVDPETDQPIFNVDGTPKMVCLKEMAANVAANKIQGEFDIDMLAQLTAEVQQLDPDLAKLMGHTDRELKKLMQLSSAPEPEDNQDDQQDDDKESLNFKVSRGQGDVIREAITFIKEHKQLGSLPHEELTGMALYFVAREFLDYTTGLKDGA